jgi:hypothetical protein
MGRYVSRPSFVKQGNVPDSFRGRAIACKRCGPGRPRGCWTGGREIAGTQP